jgi:hypothetical protein
MNSYSFSEDFYALFLFQTNGWVYLGEWWFVTIALNDTLVYTAQLLYLGRILPERHS